MRSLVGFGFWFCLLGAVPARAAPPDTAEPKTAEQRAAREAFQRGESAFQAGSYEAALAAFREAFAAVAHDAVRFNIAVCLERLGRHAEAAEQYDAASRSSLLSEADRERARRSAETARKALGTLVVDSGTAGARVSVDQVERCRIPCRIALDPGAHQVLIGEGPPLTLQVERGRQHVVVAPRAQPKTALPAAARPDRPIETPPVATAARRGPGWLTWTGGALAVAGGASTLYFGLRTQSLHDDYVREPTEERYDDGTRARVATNISIGVAAVGAVLVAVDLLLLAPRATPRAPAVGRVEW